MTRAKVCGITNREDAQCAAESGADALGFVFAESSRRVAPEQARDILRDVEPFIVGVGVFVNAPPEEVRRILELTGCSVAQLHGMEGPEYDAAVAYYERVFGVWWGRGLEEDVRVLAPYGVIQVVRVWQGVDEAEADLQSPLRHWPEGPSGPGLYRCGEVSGEAATLPGPESGPPPSVCGQAASPPYHGAKALLLDTLVRGQAGGTGKRFDLRVAEEMVKAGYRVIVAGGLTPDNVGEVVTRVRPYGVDVSSGVESAPGRKDHAKIRDFLAAVRAADEG